MAKSVVKASAKALETSAAKIGDNSEVALSAAAKNGLAKIAKLGVEYRADTKSAEKKQLDAVLLFAGMVRDKALTAEDAVKAAKAYNPAAKDRALINLTGDFKSFAHDAVIKAADYKLTPSAVPGKSHFQACMSLNRAIVRHMKEGGENAKLPVVNAAFAKAALEYSRGDTKPDLKSKDGRAKAAKAMATRLKALAEDLKPSIIKAASESGWTKAQIAAITKLAECFA